MQELVEKQEKIDQAIELLNKKIDLEKRITQNSFRLEIGLLREKYRYDIFFPLEKITPVKQMKEYNKLAKEAGMRIFDHVKDFKDTERQIWKDMREKEIKRLESELITAVTNDKSHSEVLAN